ncbi:MAG: T9SS type A sorting domain-containing protein [Bacteroidota bacterium]|nr:T9SS type A sorting domain-containing protein [Bacteroidota bacterium]
MFPHDIVGLRVYDNIIDSTAYDALQIDCAVEDCQVYANKISYYGLADDAYGLYYGMTGIVVGGGSSGDYYNNIIADGKGSGFFVFGLGDVYVYNNLILRPGRNSSLVPGPPDNHHPYGIFCDDRTTIPGKSFNFINNHIISPRDIGIRIWSLESEGNRIYNNFVLDPGVKDWNIPRAFIDVIAPAGIADTLSHNNHLDSTAFEQAKNSYFVFADTGNYRNKPGSPLIDAGIPVDTVNSIDFDIENVPRPQGEQYDVGCYEFPGLPQNFGIAPLNPVKCEGDQVQFGVPAIYHPIFDFQWLKDGNVLQGAEDSLLILENLGLHDSGSYSVILSNGFNSDTSLPGFLYLQSHAGVFAGQDTTICIEDPYLELHGQVLNDSVCWWVSSGDGWFDEENLPVTRYYPGEGDRQNGGAFLSLNARSFAPCSTAVSDTLLLGIDLCPFVAVNEISEKFRVYPNPARENETIIVQLDFPLSGTSMCLFSQWGDVILAYDDIPQNSFKRKLQISHLNKGVYFLRLLGNKTSKVSKLIVL